VGQMLKCQWWQCRGLVCAICYTCATYTLKSGYSSCHICYLISGTSLYKNTTETSDKDMLQSAKWKVEHRNKLKTELAIFNKFSKHAYKAAIWSINVYINVSSVHNSIYYITSIRQTVQCSWNSNCTNSWTDNFLSSSNVHPGSGTHPAA